MSIKKERKKQGVDNLEQVIKGCIKKKRRSQHQLYELFAAKMFAVCLRYTSSRHDAEDVLHEGFMRVFKYIRSYEFKGSFEGWIRRVFVNTALASYRGKYHLYPVGEVAELDVNAEQSGVIEQMSADELMKLVEELPPQYRMVFNLYGIEGYTHKEIAETLGISEGTSKSNLSRGRNILKKKIEALQQPRKMVK